jgi:hypothetical protein
VTAAGPQFAITRRKFIRQSFLALNTLYFFPGLGESEASAALSLTVRDAATNEIIPCSVALTTAHGELLTDNPGYSSGFRCPGEFRSDLPPGKTRVLVTRGFDYRSEIRELLLEAGTNTNCEIHLARLSSLRQDGWVCGDNHVHMKHGEARIIQNFPFLGLSARAEALDYMSVAQAWNIDVVTPEALTQACDAVSAADCMVHWNMEAPKNYWMGDVSHCMGHCWNLGMSNQTEDAKDPIAELFALSAGDYQNEKTPAPNFESHALIHSIGGVVSYTHPLRFWRGPWGGRNGFPQETDKFVSNIAQELPFDTVAGPTYDAVDIMMQTSERLVNELGEQLWFLLLNHGYRMPATASTDATFDNPGRAVPGAVRVYTRIEDELTLPRVATAMKSGRNFVTSGPLLTFTVDEKGIGEVIPISGPLRCRAHVKAWASGAPGEYLTKIEVIRNGESFKSFHPADRAKSHEVEFPIDESTTSWYIVKCFGSNDSQYAVSNPIYFQAPDFRAPQPATAKVTLQVTDAGTGKPLDGRYEVVTMIGREPKTLNWGDFSEGHAAFEAPATARIRVHVAGREVAMKSIFSDTPALLESVLEIRPEAILDWSTYESIRKTLGDLQMKFDL